MVTGIVGAAFGGIVGDRLSARGGAGGRFRTIIYAGLIFMPGVLIFCLASTSLLAAIGLTVELFSICVSSSVMYPVLQDMVPNRLRGQATAVLALLLALGSASIGPTAVAMITDGVFHNPHSLHLSLLVFTLPSAALSILVAWGGLKAYDATRLKVVGV